MKGVVHALTRELPRFGLFALLVGAWLLREAPRLGVIAFLLVAAGALAARLGGGEAPALPERDDAPAPVPVRRR
jgi:hypothetical protein